ncbi:NmrA family NAD(P)-binding protein [Citricoccus sp. NPDC079358]|uniref:NmrA family NAD(P)-binding protein n=1 Tax=Citricoccus sp. NPDC079358 TaxID=3154653 RepID=UPI00344FE125
MAPSRRPRRKANLTTDPQLTILVVGSTGSIGRHVVGEALRSGHRVRALVRSADRAAACSTRWPADRFGSR